MKRKLITLIATIAVTGTLVSTPAAFASNGKAPTNLPATQTSEQVQLQTHKFEPSIKKVPSGDNFVCQSHRNFPGQMIDADQDGVCDNLGTDGIQDHKLDGTGKKTSTKNITIKNGGGAKYFADADQDGVCDNLGTGGIQDHKLDGTGKKTSTKNITIKNGGGAKYFADADQDGICDNLGTGGIQDHKLDGTGKKTSTKNVTINKGSGKKIATQKSGTKKVTIKKVAVKNGSGEKNFVDTNQAGLCDKLGTGKIKNPKQDSTGKVEYHAKGHGAGHHK